MTTPTQHAHANTDLIFVGDVPTLVVEWEARPDGDLPLVTIPLDPQHLQPLKNWPHVDFLYDLPIVQP